MLRAPLTALLLLAAAAPLAAQVPCEVDPTRGYGVWVQTPGNAVEDTTWLAAAARAIAYRWAPPSAKREQYVGWQRVRDRILPPEPRWADDWFPGEEDRATLTLVARKDGTLRTGMAKSLSSDTLFTTSLTSITDQPMPGAPAMPAWPAGLSADSLLLTVTLGLDDTYGVRGVQHFAAIQTPVAFEMGMNTANVAGGGRRARGGGGNEGSTRLTVKYDVLASGEVKPSSIEVLDGDSSILSRIKDLVGRARVAPATSNCRPVSMTVVQTFTF
jgi:hypothetical protein